MLQSGACRPAAPGGGSVKQVTSACQQLNAHCVLSLRLAARASLTILRQLDGKVVELSLVPPTFGKDFAEPQHHTTRSVVRHSCYRLAGNVDTDQRRDSCDQSYLRHAGREPSVLREHNRLSVVRTAAGLVCAVGLRGSPGPQRRYSLCSQPQCSRLQSKSVDYKAGEEERLGRLK